MIQLFSRIVASPSAEAPSSLTLDWKEPTQPARYWREIPCSESLALLQFEWVSPLFEWALSLHLAPSPSSRTICLLVSYTSPLQGLESSFWSLLRSLLQLSVSITHRDRFYEKNLRHTGWCLCWIQIGSFLDWPTTTPPGLSSVLEISLLESGGAWHHRGSCRPPGLFLLLLSLARWYLTSWVLPSPGTGFLTFPALDEQCARRVESHHSAGLL